ncbi:MAG: ABC transporter ATP-binding protein [Pirellulaceae bacterium]|nr:ABC transporter ATP-binding protein [Pirellulaceae bacterium]
MYTLKAFFELNHFVEVQQLTKRYGSVVALDQCDLTIGRGTIFGLLGNNGAGKTTLIRCLLGFITPTTGTARVDGLDCISQSVRVRSRVAYLPADARLFRMMRGDVVLEFFSHIHPGGSLERSKKIAERLNLDLSRRVGFMSTGMRQKLAVACVLSCRAPMLILDEPTANLDAGVRSEVLQLIRDAQAAESTILFSSHILSEIEDLCSFAGIMRNGRVIRSIDIEKLRTKHRVTAIPRLHFDWPGSKNLPDAVRVVVSSDTQWVAEIDGPLEGHLAWLASMPIDQLRIEPTGLKSVYESC